MYVAIADLKETECGVTSAKGVKEPIMIDKSVALAIKNAPVKGHGVRLDWTEEENAEPVWEASAVVPMTKRF
jgi:hypothetical protein